MNTDINPFNIKNTNTDAEIQPIKPEPGGKKPSRTEEKKYAAVVYTPEQKKELLQGYIEVSSEKWADIPINSHIRYIKKNGTFARGGFVTNHWFNKEGKPFIHLANGFQKRKNGYITWPVAHVSLMKVYKKIDRAGGIEMDVVRKKTTEIVGQINRLVDVIKHQKNRIDSNEADIKKLYLIIKKLSSRLS